MVRCDAVPPPGRTASHLHRLHRRRRDGHSLRPAVCATESSGVAEVRRDGRQRYRRSAEYEVGAADDAGCTRFPFDLVIMLGDNMYGSQPPADFVRKFEQPYAAAAAAPASSFGASLGNHDRPENVSYKLFNMNGQRYYTYARNNVRFFVLDSTQMDPKQVQWLDATLRRREARTGRSATSIIRSTRTPPATGRRSICACCSSRSSSGTA